MKKREVVNLALHIGVGAALAALVAWDLAWIIFATFIYAWLREQAQHRWIHEEYERVDDVELGTFWTYRIEKQTFFGWMTGHRIWECFQWVIGAAVVVGIMEILG